MEPARFSSRDLRVEQRSPESAPLADEKLMKADKLTFKLRIYVTHTAAKSVKPSTFESDNSTCGTQGGRVLVMWQ